MKAIKRSLTISMVLVCILCFLSGCDVTDIDGASSDSESSSSASSSAGSNDTSSDSKSVASKADKDLDTLLAEAESFSEKGTGDKVLTGLVANNKYTMIHFTHSGKRNFIVTADENDKKKNLLANNIGEYDGYAILDQKGTYRLDIKADGDWTVEVVQFEKSETDSFTGTGDSVTKVFTANTDSWSFSHSGERNFIVYQYSVDKKDLTANKIGEYTGEAVSSIKKGKASFFVVNADGDWSISPKE